MIMIIIIILMTYLAGYFQLWFTLAHLSLSQVGLRNGDVNVTTYHPMWWLRVRVRVRWGSKIVIYKILNSNHRTDWVANNGYWGKHI
jgi:hypothetical protein